MKLYLRIRQVSISWVNLQVDFFSWKKLNFLKRTYLSGEWTLLINIISGLGLIRDLESKSGIAEKSGFRWLQTSLLVQKDGWLLLKGPFSLIGHDWIWNIPEIKLFEWFKLNFYLFVILRMTMFFTNTKIQVVAWHNSWHFTWEGWILKSGWLQYRVFRAWQAEKIQIKYCINAEDIKDINRKGTFRM